MSEEFQIPESEFMTEIDEEYSLTLNNEDGVAEQNPSLGMAYEEKTIYTTARSLEDATDRFSVYLDHLIETHGYNGSKPLTLWLFQRIQDGARV